MMKLSPHGVLQIARVCHEVNRAYCQALGDASQPAWEQAPDWQNTSTINGVRFHLENPEATVGATHAHWMREKIESGWTLGAAKDVEKKTHPCLVPFELLHIEQQAKDHIFRAVVHALAHLAERP